MFAEIMTTMEITGAAIIIASCLVIVWRELVRAGQHGPRRRLTAELVKSLRLADSDLPTGNLS